MLAVAISDRTNSSLAGILKTIEKIGGPSPTQEGTADAFRELLCAHYSLAVAILGQGDDAQQMGTEAGGTFYSYTAATFSELVRPMGPVWLDTDRMWRPFGLGSDQFLDQRFLIPLCVEATELYIEDSPNLRTLADSAPEYCYNATQVEPALKRNNWAVTFHTKAWIRFAKAIDLRASDPRWFLPVLDDFSIRMLTSMDLFKTLRPSFSAK